MHTLEIQATLHASVDVQSPGLYKDIVALPRDLSFSACNLSPFQVDETFIKHYVGMI